MELWQFGLLTLVGVVAGWMNVMAGGGSLLTVPIMVFMGMPGPVANGTNRIAIIAQNVVAVATFFRSGYSEFRRSLTLAAAGALGAVGGALVGVQLEGAWFNRVLAAIMIGVLVLMATGKKKGGAEADGGEPKNLALGHLAMVGAGLWGGFIQIGIGFILMPILHRILGYDLVRVNMHKVFVALVINVVALAIFAANVPIFWIAGAALAAGNALGGWLGARMTITRGEVWIRRVLYAAVSALIIKLLFF